MVSHLQSATAGEKVRRRGRVRAPLGAGAARARRQMDSRATRRAGSGVEKSRRAHGQALPRPHHRSRRSARTLSRNRDHHHEKSASELKLRRAFFVSLWAGCYIFTSFDDMSNVIMKPLVPLYSNALSPARYASTSFFINTKPLLLGTPQYLRLVSTTGASVLP